MKLETRAKKLHATIPTQGSKLSKVLCGLHLGFRLTVQSAARSCGTTELRKHVSRLIDYGWPIQSEWVTKNGDRFKEYFLP